MNINIKPLIWVISFLLILLVSGCEFPFLRVYDRSLDEEYLDSELEFVDLHLFQDEDTLELLFNRVYFRFKSKTKVKWVNFILNDSIIGTVESGSGYFELFHNFLYNGYHQLQLEIMVSSGTGSILDSLGGEGYIVKSKIWTISVKDTDYNNLVSYVENGFLKLRWEPVDLIFDEFVIRRNNVTIGRTQDFHYTDSAYVGEGASYAVYSTNGSSLWDVGRVRLPNELSLSISADRENNYFINYKPLKYYAAIESARITYFDDQFGGWKDFQFNDIFNDKFPVKKTEFGVRWTGRIYINPKYKYKPDEQGEFPDESEPHSAPYSLRIGYPAEVFWNISRVDESRVLIEKQNGFTKDSLIVYSLTENKILQHHRYVERANLFDDIYTKPNVSPDGKKYISNIPRSNKMIYGSTGDLTNYEIISIEVPFATQDICLSNNGLIFFHGDRDQIHLYDLNANALIGTINDYFAESYGLSSEGKYVYKTDNNSIITYQNTGSEIIVANEYDHYGLDHFTRNNTNDIGLLVYWNEQSKVFSHKEYASFNTIMEFVIPESTIIDVDFNTGVILCSGGKNNLVVRDLYTGEVIESIQTKFDYFYSKDFHLAGNSIYHRYGIRYFYN